MCSYSISSLDVALQLLSAEGHRELLKDRDLNQVLT
jgi:hypothetical protein